MKILTANVNNIGKHCVLIACALYFVTNSFPPCPKLCLWICCRHQLKFNYTVALVLGGKSYDNNNNNNNAHCTCTLNHNLHVHFIHLFSLFIIYHFNLWFFFHILFSFIHFSQTHNFLLLSWVDIFMLFFIVSFIRSIFFLN